MDKKSEQRASHKGKDDTDEGVHEYGIGNKREQLNGLWGVTSKEVVGLSPSRIATNDYCKEKKGEKKGKDKTSIIDSLLENGPPLLNMSKPHRVF
jgi:hypothetical protein